MNAAFTKEDLSQHSASAASPERVLRRLFLTLFLRGRSARGLRKGGAPKSVARKLAVSLAFYALFGLFALTFLRQPVFALSVYLHAMTLVFLGMFVAASAGEVLFNKEEADILMHRPVEPRALLWAKIAVLTQVSLWLAGAFNLAGLFVGLAATDGKWSYPIVHAVSTAAEALFCTGSVVLIYQLCLRWFGRERLEGLMTTAQVLIAVAAVVAGQLAPQLLIHVGPKNLELRAGSWWIGLLPPAWFAGLDDAIAGRATVGSWVLAMCGLAATSAVLWLSFGKLAKDYQSGLQAMEEVVPRQQRRRRGRRWLDVLVHALPIRWWLRDPVARASFLLTAAYLARDRDVKLRVYPSLAPMLMMPVIFLLQDFGHHAGNGGFGTGFTAIYLGIIPMMAVKILRHSQQWQAADVFRVAPMAGPGSLCHGVRRAVLCFLALPLVAFFVLVLWVIPGGRSGLPLLLPGLITLPLYALIGCSRGRAVPLALPTEEARSAERGLSMLAVMVVSMALSGIASWAWSAGWFRWLLAVEASVATILYLVFFRSITKARWDPI